MRCFLLLLSLSVVVGCGQDSTPPTQSASPIPVTAATPAITPAAGETPAPGKKKKDPIPLEQIPENIMAIAKEKLPGINFDRAVKKQNGDFEIIGKDKDGKVREIDITPAGEVTEIE